MGNERTLTDEQIKDLVVNDLIRRLLSKPVPMTSWRDDLNEYSLEIISESAPVRGVKDPVLVEVMRIVNGMPVLAGAMRSQAAFYMFGDGKGGDPYFILTEDLRQLLLDDAPPSGNAIWAARSLEC